MGVFGANTAYLHLETPRLQEAYFSKMDRIQPGIKCARW
jgi:hypothetical protein